MCIRDSLVADGMADEVKQDIENTFVQIYEQSKKKIEKSRVIESIAYIFRYIPNKRTKVMLRRIATNSVLSDDIKEIANQSLKFIKQQSKK